jgi:N-dimethylarginine dimethylaminohydrolase
MSGFGGQTMVGSLKRVAVCSPRAAGWFDDARWEAWEELGLQHAPEPHLAEEQHAAMCAQLEEAGVQIERLEAGAGFDAGLTLDAVYAHDASLITDHGAILMRMGKEERDAEPAAHRALYESLGIPVLGEIAEPGTAEAGDCVWLDARTLLVGRGYRTNGAGIEQLRALLAPHGIEVIPAPLPHGKGPLACLHLMSLLSLLDERTALVDQAWLAVETVELLTERDFTFVHIEPGEQSTLACNILSLGERRLLALEDNFATNQLLADAGFDVRTFPGSEIGVNGAGGPTCLTRPLLRA